MKLKTRRIIYISFFIIFFLLSTGIVLYTAGYYYHFKKDKFQRSGGILLEFKPKEVEVYIQDKKRETTGFFDSSFKIASLLPGEYEVSLIKKGYHTWHKKLTVEGEKINFIKNIILFKSDIAPKLLAEGQIENVAPFPKKEKIFFTERKNNLLNLKLYDETSNKMSSIASLKTTSTEDIVPEFSFSEKRLSFYFKGKNYIYSLGKDELIIIENKFPSIKNIEAFQWSLTSDDAAYILSKNEIYQLNLLDYSLNSLLSEKSNTDFSINDFSIIGNKIYLIYSNDSNYLLGEREKNTKGTVLLKNDISPGFRFMPSPRPFITLLDEENNKLMVINIATREIIFEDSAIEVLWSDKLDGENYKIAYNNDFEIYTYDVDSEEKILVNRHSEMVDKISWYPDYSHLAFVYNNSINITDIDKNNEKAWHTLFSKGEIKNILVSFDGKKLYFEGKVDEQSGLFELDIL